MPVPGVTIVETPGGFTSDWVRTGLTWPRWQQARHRIRHSENEPGRSCGGHRELRSISETRTQLGGWRAVTVDPDNHGPSPALEVIDGRPVITYVPDDAFEATSASFLYASSAQADGGGGWSAFPVEVSVPGFVMTGRTLLSTFGDGFPQIACTVVAPGVPGVEFVLLATNYTDTDNVTFFDDFQLYDVRLPDPLDATRKVVAGLVDRGNRPGLGLATLRHNAHSRFTTLD